MFWRTVKFTVLFWGITGCLYFVGTMLFYFILGLFAGGMSPASIM